MINRRSFVAGYVTLTATAKAFAQPPRRIALLDIQEPNQPLTEFGSAEWKVFLGELRRLGYKEGENIIIDRWSGKISAAEVMSRQPEVIVATLEAAIDVWDQIVAIPIVLVGFYEGDIDEDFLFELDRSNVVGAGSYDVLFERATELPKMQLQLLRRIVSSRNFIGWLSTFTYFDDCPGGCRFIASAAQKLGLGLQKVMIMDSFGQNDPPSSQAYWENQIKSAFSSMASFGYGGFITSNVYILNEYAELVGRLAIANRLPGITKNRKLADAGLLMCCQSDTAHLFRRGANSVDRLLKGASPAGLEVEPAKFNLIINKRTARLIGLTLPPALLASASEIIE